MYYPNNLDECNVDIKKQIRDLQDKIVSSVEKDGNYVWFFADTKLKVLSTVGRLQ